MAQMVKAVRMILGKDMLGSTPQNPVKHLAKDIEIEDDAPERKPSLEEIDALEVILFCLILLKNYYEVPITNRK